MFLKDLTPEDKQSLIQHLEDLRKAVIISIVAIMIATIACFSKSEYLLTIVMRPLSAFDQKLIVTGVTEAFFVKIQLSFLFGFVIAFPIVLLSLWRFVRPALYPHERKYVYIILPISILLFLGGILFSYFGILKMVLNFFIYIAGNNLETMFKVDQYISFVMAFTLPFGIVFEMPVITFFLSRLGIIKYESMNRNRKYALLVIFVIAAALTPGPDPISQLMMGIPMYLLYEISIVVAKFSGRKTAVEAEEL